MPSAADGKGPFAVSCPKQTATQLFVVPYFAVTFCRLRLTAKVFAVRRGRQKWTAKYGTTKSYIAVRFGRLTAKGPLPSAADDKEY